MSTWQQVPAWLVKPISTAIPANISEPHVFPYTQPLAHNLPNLQRSYEDQMRKRTVKTIHKFQTSMYINYFSNCL